MSTGEEKTIGLNHDGYKQVYKQVLFPIINEDTNGRDGENENNLISGLFAVLKSFPGIPIQNKLVSIDYVKKILETYL